MTVDMLAATFFWPEGTVLGARHSHPDEAGETDEPAESHDGADAAARTDGFWSAVMRHLWRPSSGAATVAAP